MQTFDGIPARRQVLYLEDNDINVLLMRALFERRLDLQLLVAPTCAEALRSATNQPPDLLLLDLRLPDGDGAALLPVLRALPGLRRIPAVAVTAEAVTLPDLRDFDALWPKPLQLGHVLDQLDHWLPCSLQSGPTLRSGLMAEA